MKQKHHDEIAEYLGYNIEKHTYSMPHGSAGEFSVTFYYKNGIQYHLNLVNWWPDISAAFKALGCKRMPSNKQEASQELERIWQARKDGTLIKDVMCVQQTK